METHVTDGGVVLTVVSGHLVRATAELALDEFRRALRGVDNPVWILDTLPLHHFEPSVVSVGATWFRIFRARRGSRVLVVTKQPASRMVAATLSFSTGLRVDTFEDTDLALADLGFDPSILTWRRPSTPLPPK